MDLDFWNVDAILSKVDLSTTQPVIDLGPITFVKPFALVYLGMYLRHYNHLGKSFQVGIPNSPDARRYLARMRFWERFNFNPEMIKQESLMRFTSSTSLNDIVDIENTPTIAEDIAEGVGRVLRVNDVRVNSSLIIELVAELVDNFAQHSERTLAACMVQYFPRLHRVVFAIGDCGIGIRESLASNPRHANVKSMSHCEAALEAFKPLVSRRDEGGTGLTEVADGITSEKGDLLLSTGDGYVKMSSRRTEIGPMHFDLPGVQVELSFPERGAA